MRKKGVRVSVFYKHLWPMPQASDTMCPRPRAPTRGISPSEKIL